MPRYLDFKEAKCKNCYKCLKGCPVKAIKIENSQAKIIEDRCVLCGKCTLICPQNAKEVHSELENVKELLKSQKVIASVAPSFISSFNMKSFYTMKEALKKVGFVFAEETARGAKVVTDKYEELLKTKKFKNFVTSCCPAINKMISLYYPESLKYLAIVDSPVIAHAKILKEENPDCKIVFIGPCIAKKRECQESKIVDGALTFEDLVDLFEENNIDLYEIEHEHVGVEWNKARYYPISRGIIKSFDKLIDDYEYIAVDGIERAKEVLEDIDNIENVFLEINACRDSCINGPCNLKEKYTSISANAKVRKYANENQTIRENDGNYKKYIDVSHVFKRIKCDEKIPTEEEISEILAMTGKFVKDDELNCGACGYPTCREKAWAVYNGYADIGMCLPYMRERAENLSNEIMNNSPNGIVVIDQEFKIIDINEKAKALLGITKFKPKEEGIFNYLDEIQDFAQVLNEKKNIHRKQIKIEKTNSYIELSLIYMEKHHMMFAIMKDITEKVNYDAKLAKVKLETLAITDEVIKKQMRAAQEIASLLGETTAETKVALVNLKKTLQDEKNEE